MNPNTQIKYYVHYFKNKWKYGTFANITASERHKTIIKSIYTSSYSHSTVIVNREAPLHHALNSLES